MAALQGHREPEHHRTGTIHGNGIAFMGKELSDSYELKPLQDPSFDPRPHVLTLIGVKRLVIRM